MKLTVEHLHKITGDTRNTARKEALAAFLNGTAARFSNVMDQHRLAIFLSQIMHESGNLRYVKEVWGPTAAQSRYEGRADLGNTQKGDGKRFMGRDVIQVTGRANHRALTAWCRKMGIATPDFEAHPEALEDPKWLGLGALWYWIERVPSRYVEEGNHEMVTRRINGGLNGYADRLAKYTRAALVLLGYEPESVRAFQSANDLTVDGIAGPATRAALHNALRMKGEVVKPPAADYAPVPPPPFTYDTGSYIAAFFKAITAFFQRKG